jgi:hypothetical protein
MFAKYTFAAGHRCKIAKPTNSIKSIKSTKTHYTKDSSIRDRISRLLYRRKRLNWGYSEILTLLESDIAVVARLDANNLTIDDFEPKFEKWQPSVLNNSF